MTNPPELMSPIDHFHYVLRLPTPDERRALRVNANVTQSLMGRVLGTSAQNISNWEERGYTPGRKHIAAYVALLEELRQRAEATVTS